MSDWQTTATLKTLKARAAIIANIRQFFDTRDVLEIETPLLCSNTATDPHILSIAVAPERYLQTSPEFLMKRALACGSGPIYQISKAFRQNEQGRFHNPEFTLLEWYRVGFNHHALMDEMDDLLRLILKTSSAEKISYAELFQRYLAINPHTATIAQLMHCAKKHNLSIQLAGGNIDDWLNILLTHLIEPHLGFNQPAFIYDYPITQAALSRIRQDDIPVAERFEVYYKGIELANGFHELTNAKEQKQRFLQDLQQRKTMSLAAMPIDDRLLAALENGLPACAGVALGIDRLVMLALDFDSIDKVISFRWDNC